MKRKTFFSTLAVLFAVAATAQSKDTVVRYFYDGKLTARGTYYDQYKKGVLDDGRWHARTYRYPDNLLVEDAWYVDANFSTRQGACTLFIGPDKIVGQGHYNKNRKTGLWKIWHKNGRLSDSANYRNDTVVGWAMAWYDNGKTRDSAFTDEAGTGYSYRFWENGNPQLKATIKQWKHDGKLINYHPSGVVAKEADWEAGVEKTYRCFDLSGNPVNPCLTETDAQFPGGDAQWVAYIKRRIGKALEQFYMYKKDFTSGTSLVRFIIEKDGTVQGVQLEKSCGDALLDEYAIEMIRESPDWIPASQKGRPARAYRRQPITFLRGN